MNNFLSYTIVLSFMILFMISPIVNAGVNKNLLCEVTGVCTACHKFEKDTDYCRETGKRVKIHCKDSESEFDDFKSCSTTAEDDQINVIIFQIVMAIIGGLAYWGVQSRKKYNMTLFDHRKLR